MHSLAAALQESAVYANSLGKSQFIKVRLEIDGLGLVARANGFNKKKIQALRMIGWEDLDSARAPLPVIRNIIDRAFAEVERAMKGK